MIEAVSGVINNSITLSFDVGFGGHDCIGPGCQNAECGSLKVSNPTDIRKPIVKGSKAFEKGSFVQYIESEEVENNSKFFVTFKDMLNTVTAQLGKDLTKPRIRVYSNIPTPQNYEISEFFLEGNFEILKVNVEPSKKTVMGDALTKRLEAEEHLSIDGKLFFKIVGPALQRQSVIKTSHGDIVTIRSTLDVEI